MLGTTPSTELPTAISEGPTTPKSSAKFWQKIEKKELARVIVVAACAAAITLGLTWPTPSVPAIALVGLLVGCWNILVEAWHDLRARRMSMESAMLVAIAAAAIIGEWATSLLITLFVLLAEILEELSMSRGRDALTDLLSFLPEEVLLKDGTRRPLSEVQPGDIIVVTPGGNIPVDGVVMSGSSTLDQSRITGEPLPVDVGPGDSVMAGSINYVGALEVQAQHVGGDSSFGKIVEAVRKAQDSQPPAQHIADRLATWVMYISLAGAALTFLLTRDSHTAISVVVVAGACGVVAGTPLATLAAIARIAKRGAFVKDGAHLEALSEIDTIVFDKTGTLTRGVPEVCAVESVSGFSDDDVLAYAAGAEAFSEHPLGQAIADYARGRGVAIPEASDFDYTPGRGITATVDGKRISAGNSSFVSSPSKQDDTGVSLADRVPSTRVNVAIDGVFAGHIMLRDSVRESAPGAMTRLRRLGLRSLMITGDQRATATVVGKELRIDEVHAELLPEDKLAIINDERKAGHRLAMVGDGVNDAPALACANVGISMGSGTAIAQESSDVVLVSSDLGDLAWAVEVARRARRIVMFNFVGTILVDAVGMVLAALGYLDPTAAALVHVGSETAFIINSARLIPGKNLNARAR
ncbi:cadmium-translocating P-type ATPase [Arcanobacterium haemolyticum]|nr:cadmium-translocating P-type ATPase [Arcanobacterium haemolyticum]